MNDAPQATLTTLEHFMAAASYVLSQIAGAELQATSTPPQLPVEAATLVRVSLSGALEGLCEIALSAPMSGRFASLLTGEEPQAEVSSETREAAAELIQQICGNAADRLRAAFGQLELKTAVIAEREGGDGERWILSIPHGDAPLELELHVVSLKAAQTANEEAATTKQAEPKAVTAAAPSLESTVNHNLDLLLDIELDATLRFGTRQMLLKEILDLCSGSVVELDRGVQEPVDLLIDGRVIAHGEVVIVDGNYGLRVLQVASNGDKVACLS
jgi:flagellar motor switch protein FliN/FliY